MDISLSEQAFMFLAMIVCGAFCGLVFDFFRAVRRVHRSPGGIVAVQDVIFWLIELTIVYLVAFRLNYAKIRAYEAVALVIGSWVYFMTVSNYVIVFFCRIIVFLLKTLNFLLIPARKLFFFSKKLKTALQKQSKKLKNKLSMHFHIPSFAIFSAKWKKILFKKIKN